MARKKKQKAKFPRTASHLEKGHDRLIQGPSGSPPNGRQWGRRLSWTIDPVVEFEPANLAAMIHDQNNKDVRWLCDANMFIGETDNVIWDSLLAKSGRLMLPIPVYHELNHWLADPKYNTKAHVEVEKAIAGDDSAIVHLLDVPRHDALKSTSLEYYVNLLGLRKDANTYAQEKLREKLGRDPTKNEVNNFTKDELGLRGQLLAMKGASGASGHRYNDEVLVMLALMFAVSAGNETAILTRDEDVLEQFYKGLWLVDTHYRSMLLADLYSEDRFAFTPTKRVQDSEREAFEGEVTLLRKPSAELTELLPQQWDPVFVHCLFLKGNRLTKLSFCAETQLSRLFDVKARTGGLNTEVLDDGANCHVFLGDRFVEKVGNWAAIGQDRKTTKGEWNYSLSVIDVNLALTPCEEFTRSRVVDPNQVLLP